MHRYFRAKFLFANQNISKYSNKLGSVGKKELKQPIQQLVVSTGLFKFSNLEEQHLLIFANLTGKLPVLREQCHGKRGKRTVSLAVTLSGLWVNFALDKLINEVLPRIVDYKTIRVSRVKKNKSISNYSYKLNQRYTPLMDFLDLMTSRMYTAYRGLFLPLEYNFSIFSADTKMVEDYFHKLQLPFIFFKRKYRPAFDDKKVIDIRKSRQVDNTIKKKHKNVY